MGVVVPNQVQILVIQVVREVQIQGIQAQIRGIQVLVVGIQEIVGQIQIIQVVQEVQELELIQKPTQQTLQQHPQTLNQVGMVELPTQLQTPLRLLQVVLHQMHQKVVVEVLRVVRSQMLGLVQ